MRLVMGSGYCVVELYCMFMVGYVCLLNLCWLMCMFLSLHVC